MTGLLLLDHRQVLLEKLGTIGLEAHHLHLDQHLVVLSAEREGERERERERGAVARGITMVKSQTHRAGPL